MIEKEDFFKIYATLCEAFRFEYKTERALIYYEVLKGADPGRIQVAVKRALVECVFMPSIAEIVSRLGSSAGESWEKVFRVACRGGRGWEDLTDQEVGTIAEIGGMSQIQNASDESLHFIANRYLDAYPKLAGISFASPDIRLKTLGMDPESLAYLLRSREPDQEALPDPKIRAMIGQIGREL